MAEQQIILSTRNLVKDYKNGSGILHVLKNINLDIIQGEFLTILGESGSGKSTLLNIIGGLDCASSGNVTFMGEDLTKMTKEQLSKYRRHHVGVIFQQQHLMPNLTAKQNIQLMAELVKNPMGTDEVLELVGLTDKADNYPAQLSGGQQQRISIARTLVKRPKLILADEPTAALDYATSIEVLKVFETIMKTGTTLVMVTHNEEITRMSNRIIRIRDGKLSKMIVNSNPVHADELVW